MHVNINKLDNYGRGIAYINNKICFINNSLPNEEVIIDNIIDKKKYSLANCIKIINSSNDRTDNNCKYYDRCGGCQLRHFSNNLEREFKINKVKDILHKYTHLDIDINYIESDKYNNYRNKIELHINNYEYGYFNTNSNTFVKIDECLLASNSINKFIKDRPIKFKNGRLTIRSNYKDELLVIIDSKDEVKYDKLDSNIKGIIYNNKLIYGNNYFYDYIGNYKFKVSYDSFMQINNYIASKISLIIKDNLIGNNILDLYCGIGFLGISSINEDMKLIGIEKVSNAIKDANINAKLNNLSNTYFYTGDTYKVLSKLNIKPDTIIIDPPRSGLNKGTIDTVINLNAKRVIYVSCDPMTLARDLSILSDKYIITKVYALNMFPRTYHVECMVILNHK